MRIALDATYSVGDSLSGVGVYSNALLDGLAASHREASFDFCYRPHRLLRSFRRTLPPNCHRRLLTESRIPLRAELFHGLNQRLPCRADLRRAVTTFHDLFILSGDYSTPEFRRRFAGQAREAAKRSDAIIAVSSFTASQVRDLLDVDSARIRVVHHGVKKVDGPVPPVSGREKMILHVGAIQRRKNVLRLVEAFERIGSGWSLVLAGSIGYGGEEILERVRNSPRRESIKVTGYADEAALRDLYLRAAVFAFPSLDEGFGLPVLEAMAAGMPVLTSNRGALPEVSGDAALAVDPSSVEAIADGLCKLTADEGLREAMASRGLARSALFTWEEAVRRTWEVYEEISP